MEYGFKKEFYLTRNLKKITISTEMMPASESSPQIICKCQNISVNEVVAAVKNGAQTVEQVMEETKAGTGCGRCKGIISNIIENKK